MAKIILAKSAGYCFGVNRAINMVENLVAENKKVATLGLIIHNQKVVNNLKQKGVLTVDEPNPDLGYDVLVIRSHGVSEEVEEKIKQIGDYVDATCPKVSNIHKIVSKASQNGDTVLIAGDRKHPEVLGILGRIKTKHYIFDSLEELQELINSHKELMQNPLTAVCQTTFNATIWTKCQKYLKKVCTNVSIFDTICKATALRQQEADELSKICDLMIVIGDTHSSNTSKLKDVCLNNCKKTILIEDASQLPISLVESADVIGVTAGASTPDAIIKEVLNKMSEIENKIESKETAEKSFDEMTFEEALEASLNSLNSDQKVKGVVLTVNPTEIQVDIGRKQTGVIPYREYSNDVTVELVKEVKVGDILDLIIMKTNDQDGFVMCSKRRFDAIAGWDEIIKAKEEGTVLEGKITEVNKGGVVVFYNGFRIFVPSSQATLNRVDSLEDLKGDTVKFRIIEIERKRRAIGSIRSVLREERKANVTAFWENIAVGQKIEGTVKTLTNYGAFVDLGGVDGMVHISELSWAKIKKPADVVAVGDTIEVVVKEIDLEKHKISLKYKKDEDNPWEKFVNNYKVEDVTTATIVSLTSYGAFARIIPGIEGLIHISQISDKRIEKPNDVLKVGQEVNVKIVDVDFNKKHISLSIKATLEPEAVETAEAEEIEEIKE